MAAGAVVAGLVGPLDYAFRTYTILPDRRHTATVRRACRDAVRPVAAGDGARSSRSASFNLERFFDTVNDPGIGEPVLTAAAFDDRLNKASLAIRDVLRRPTSSAWSRSRTWRRCRRSPRGSTPTRSRPASPIRGYAAYLVEGNDIGGIDVGFLVKTARVDGRRRASTSASVVQEDAATLYTEPGQLAPRSLNDRPPLRPDGAWSTTPDGGTLPAHRDRQPPALAQRRRRPTPARRLARSARACAPSARAQAEYLAEPGAGAPGRRPGRAHRPGRRLQRLRVQRRPGRRRSAPSRARRRRPTAVVLASADLRESGPRRTWSTPCRAAERYSYVFDGNAQVLDHVLVNGPGALASVVGDRLSRGERRRAGDGAQPRHVVVADFRSRRRGDTYLRATPPDVTAQVRITRLPFVFNPLTRVSLSVVGRHQPRPGADRRPDPPGVRRSRAGAPSARRERRDRRRSVPDAERSRRCGRARRGCRWCGSPTRARAGGVHAAGAVGRVLVCWRSGPQPDRGRPVLVVESFCAAPARPCLPGQPGPTSAHNVTVHRSKAAAIRCRRVMGPSTAAQSRRLATPPCRPRRPRAGRRISAGSTGTRPCRPSPGESHSRSSTW